MLCNHIEQIDFLSCHVTWCRLLVYYYYIVVVIQPILDECRKFSCCSVTRPHCMRTYVWTSVFIIIYGARGQQLSIYTILNLQYTAQTIGYRTCVITLISLALSSIMIVTYKLEQQTTALTWREKILILYHIARIMVFWNIIKMWCHSFFQIFVIM